MARDIYTVDALLRSVHVATVLDIAAIAPDRIEPKSESQRNWASHVCDVMVVHELAVRVKTGVYQHPTASAPEPAAIEVSIVIRAKSRAALVEAAEQIADRLDVDRAHAVADCDGSDKRMSWSLNVTRGHDHRDEMTATKQDADDE